MKTFLENIYHKLKSWLACGPDLNLERFEKLESKKYQKRGGCYGE
jgi:hypothetical protein